MKIDLVMRRSELRLRDPVAWLISGSDVAQWLDEIASWSVPDARQMELRILVLPTAQTLPKVPGTVPGTFGGALVCVPPSIQLAMRPVAVPYGSIGRKLLLPVDAVLEPDVSQDEVDALIHHERAVLHPSLGWIGVREDELLTLSDLLSLPPLSPRRWSAPQTPPSFNKHIHSISLETPVSLEDFFEAEQEDIGTRSPSELPEGGDEPGDSLFDQWKRKTMEPIARGVLSMTERMPDGADEPTWVDRLDRWAREKLDKMSSELDHVRHKELHRLLDLLDSDIEAGLRHAIPFGGSTFRGRTMPGASLVEREVDFTLGAFGGGGPVDPWTVPMELEQKLRTKYRELANQERSLGRYRRAAYIYAELLGDLDTAAVMLREGKHFREAAEIYRRHLQKPREAAKAYADGGLYLEAAGLYEELELWEQEGDVYVEMEDEAKAHRSFMKARDQALASFDRLGAARIVESKLADVEAAIAIVEDGWPDSRQAGECLRQHVKLLAQEGRHRGAESLLKRLDAEETPPHVLRALAETMADTATTYPDTSVRRRAGDLTRKKVGGRLPKASATEASHLLRALYTLAPEDELLVRDGARYLRAKEEEREQARPRPVRRVRGPEPELVRRVQLPPSIAWSSVRSMGSLFFTLGMDKSHLKLFRGNWAGVHEALSWPFRGDNSSAVLFELDVTGHRTVILRDLAGHSLAPQKFMPSRDVVEAETFAGDPEWLPSGTVAVASRASIWLVLRFVAERFVLSSYGLDGVHLADVAEWTPEGTRFGLASQNEFVVVAQSLEGKLNQLLVFDAGNESRFREPGTRLAPRKVMVPSYITGLRAAQPFTRSRVAVTMELGVLLHWLQGGGEFLVAEDMVHPSACILRNGALVVARGQRLRVYRTDDIPTMTCDVELSGMSPVLDVVPGYAPNQFAVFTERGALSIYSLPSG